MKSAVLAIVGSALLWTVASARTSDELGRVVFSADNLRRAGVTRPAEVILLVEDWRPTTLDGLSWRGSLSGLGHFDGQQWQVMIDGKPIAINLFATGAINRLPILMTQIDSVEVVMLPQLHHGRFVDTGLIHFHTSVPRSAWAGSGRVMVGNETGEPGPYQFTELATPNVERIGPDYSFDVAASGSAGFVRGGYTGLTGYAIDDATTRRNDFIGGGEAPSLDVDALAFRGGFGIGRSHHDVYVGGSRFDDYYFLKPYGREVPTRVQQAHLAASGDFPINDRRVVRYRVALANDQLLERSNALDLDFTWRQRELDADVEVDHAGGRYQVVTGVGVRAAGVETAYELDDSDDVNARVYGQIDFASGATLKHKVGGALRVGRNDVAASGSWHLVWSTWRWGALQLVTAYHERLPVDDDRIWYWHERGYDFLEDNGVDVTRTDTPGVARRFSIDSMWRKKCGVWTLEAKALYRAFANQQVESQRYQFQSFDKSFIGPVTVHAGQSGGIAGAKLALEYDSGSRVRARAAYSFQETVQGDNSWVASWDAVARQHGRAEARFDVNRSFGVWALLNYWSATTWADYREVEQQSGGEYTARLPAIVLLDVAFDKWLWREWLHGNIMFRNALDRKVAFHPIGASFDLSVFVQIELLLGVRRP